MVRNAGNNRRGAGRGGNRRRGQGERKNAQTRLPNQLVLKPSYTAPYKFSRSFSLGGLPKSAADQGYAWPFALNQIPSSTEFTNLFDKYRITGIDLTFTYWRESGGVADTIWPAMYLFMDDDDAVIPTTRNEALERMSVQRVSFAPTRQTISVKIKPRWIQSRGGVSTNLAPLGAWIDMATPGVQHFGVKAWVDFYNTGAGDTQVAANGVMHFECNNVR